MCISQRTKKINYQGPKRYIVTRNEDQRMQNMKGVRKTK